MAYENTTIIAGHSHTAALGVEFGTQKTDAVLKPLLHQGYDDFVGLAYTLPIDPPYWEALYNVSKNRRVGLLYNGSQHVHNFLLIHAPEFDFLLPGGEGSVDEKKKLVPFRMIRELFLIGLTEMFQIIERLKTIEGCQPFIIGSPPPRGDSVLQNAFDAKDSWFEVFAKLLQINLGSTIMSSPLLRYKAWVALQSVFADVAKQHGLLFISAPREAGDAEGFLRPEFYLDFTHANVDYGKLMLNRIRNELANSSMGAGYASV